MLVSYPLLRSVVGWRGCARGHSCPWLPFSTGIPPFHSILDTIRRQVHGTSRMLRRAVLIVWGGLRGAVALVLAFMVYRNAMIPSKLGRPFLTQVCWMGEKGEGWRLGVAFPSPTRRARTHAQLHVPYHHSVYPCKTGYDDQF